MCRGPGGLTREQEDEQCRCLDRCELGDCRRRLSRCRLSQKHDLAAATPLPKRRSVFAYADIEPHQTDRRSEIWKTVTDVLGQAVRRRRGIEDESDVVDGWTRSAVAVCRAESSC